VDTLHRFLFEDLDIRGALVRLGPAWREMQGSRGYAPAVRDLLGELTAVGTLIASNLKVPGHLNFYCRGKGPVSLLVVDCDNQLRLRGLAKAEGATPVQAGVPQLIGEGQLELTLQLGERGHRYESIVPLEGNTTAAIFEHYLTQSEQSPARLWLHADGAHACGLFLQKLPGADARDADGWNRMQHLAATVTAPELTFPAETLLTRLFPEETLRLFDAQDVSYHCPRDEQKVLDMLRLLGRDEVEATLEEKGIISVTDDICNQEYRYGREIVDQLFPPDAPPSAKTIH
jgi:molecular chaperone Hsp33